MFYEFQHFNMPEYTKKEYGENFSFPKHLHQAFEFITVFFGEMTVTVDSDVYILTPGKALLIFPNQLHSLSSTQCSHMLYIFPPELIRAYSSKIAGNIPQRNIFSPQPYIIDELKNLCENASLVKKKGLFYSLCAQFDEQAEYINRKHHNENILYSIFEFVKNNCNKDCSLHRLAAQTGYSYSYLSRHFKNTVGISFNNYVNQFRISNACYLLDNTNCSVLQCALDCGYNSLRSFNRNFKNYLSMTPNEYKKQRDCSHFKKTN